jgi:hypothetical protein
MKKRKKTTPDLPKEAEAKTPPPDPLVPLDEQMEKAATGTPEIHLTKDKFGE